MTDSMLGVEKAARGWSSICATLGCSRWTAMRRKAELQAAGVIFYMKQGKPPKRNVYHFPSRLRAWIGLKSSKGEEF